AAFSVCIGAAPQLAGCFYNRALALVARGQGDRALRDLDRAIELDGQLGAARLNRGILRLESGQFAAAAEDFDRALAAGADPGAVHYHLALVHLAENDRAAPLTSLNAALRHDPAHAAASKLLDQLRREP